MQIKSARFVISNTDISQCPKPDRPEYAFIGRSNVGKSSLINMLTGVKGLAKTSQKPGKTQLINHFSMNEESSFPWYLVDLPGYGFAKVPVKLKDKWLGFIKGYLRTRQNLCCTFVLVDSRHSPQKIDLEFMEWLGESEIPFVIVFTKLDKLKNPQVAKVIPNYKAEMLKTWEEIPQTFLTSAEKGIGKEELLAFINDINQSYS